MHSLSCTVAIVGCGLGGLAAAIGIRQAGHRVVIFESAATLSEVGAGIQIPCNCARILASWGLLNAIESTAISPSNIILRSYKGPELSRQNLIPFVQDTYSASYHVIHRRDFHRVLVDKARALGVDIRLNSLVTKVDFSKPSLELQGGEKFEADLIIGADGVNSKCRAILLGHASPLQNTGQMAYRMTVSMKDVQSDAELQSLIFDYDINCWMGPLCHIVTYALREDGLFNVIALAPDRLPPDQFGGKTTIEEVQQLFAGWDFRLLKLFGLAKYALMWKLQDSEEMVSWSSGQRKFTLLGDASHATLPYLAQGAAMAVEDGAVLGKLFERLQDTGQIPELVETYERIRKPRTTAVIRGSMDMCDIFNLPDGEQQQERDRDMGDPRPPRGNPNRWADPAFQRFLFDYDVEREVDKAWRERSQQ